MHREEKKNPDVEDIRAKRKTYKRRTWRNITKFQGAVKGPERKNYFFSSMRICGLAHITSVAQKGGQERGSILPDTLPAQEQNIDHGAPGAKRRHHFSEVTEMIVFYAPPHIPCVKMKTKIKTKIKVKWNEMELNEMEWN